jgi:hypothetical protein
MAIEFERDLHRFLGGMKIFRFHDGQCVHLVSKLHTADIRHSNSRKPEAATFSPKPPPGRAPSVLIPADFRSRGADHIGRARIENNIIVSHSIRGRRQVDLVIN